jgi:hypothetical protein
MTRKIVISAPMILRAKNMGISILFMATTSSSNSLPLPGAVLLGLFSSPQSPSLHNHKKIPVVSATTDSSNLLIRFSVPSVYYRLYLLEKNELYYCVSFFDQGKN